MQNDHMLLNQLEQIFSTKRMSQAKTLLVVPPFVRLEGASHGVHILQSCAKASGHEVAIFYANMLFAQLIGQDCYNAITFYDVSEMLGDRVFANAAYDLPLLGTNAAASLGDLNEKVPVDAGCLYTLTYKRLLAVAEQASIFTYVLGQFIATKQFSCVGCTTMFNQTAASVALLNKIKSTNKQVVTIIGGANCAGDMAKGVASLSTNIDYVFDGESETVFVDLLKDIANDKRPENGIIHGIRCDDLDSIPTTDFAEYYSQVDSCQIKVDWDHLYIPYEASRGCWWGQKHHCTFCGVYEMRYRTKSPDRVIAQLQQLLEQHPCKYVNFTDDIMPLKYFKTLLPRLQPELPGLHLFMDQKPNLSIQQVRLLVSSGVGVILPGIESFSTPLLKAMDKGVSGRQNIQLMRYARSCGLDLAWFLLSGIPGENPDHYQEFLTLLPLITHLPPPDSFRSIDLIRFGLYVADSESYQLSNLRPSAVYGDILPTSADIENLAYYYSADHFTIESKAPEVFNQIDELVNHWRKLWLSYQQPVLHIEKINDDRYVLTDTRAVQTKQKYQFINEAQAAAALVGHPVNQIPVSWQSDWAISNQLAVMKDKWIVPLATANAELIEKMETRYKKTRINPKIEVTVAI